MACEGLKVSPEQCLYVGDGGSKDLTVASESGMKAVLIRAPYDTVSGNREDWRGASVSTISEVLALVNGLGRGHLFPPGDFIRITF